MQRIIESKRAARREFAAMSFGDKLRILERLRDAARLFNSTRPLRATDPARLRKLTVPSG